MQKKALRGGRLESHQMLQVPGTLAQWGTYSIPEVKRERKASNRVRFGCEGVKERNPGKPGR